jgi:Glycosyl hydrolase family 99
MAVSRRLFLSTGIRAGLAAPLLGIAGCRSGGPIEVPTAPATPTPVPSPDLAALYPDLRRHFILEYYPWYGGPPNYDHWDYLDRHPPLDLASQYVPALGPYDVRDTKVLEQHARWITESGAGAIVLSWWGQGSWQDQRVGLIMDVMRDHDLKVTFAMEPYADDRGPRFANDVLYLLREYGEKRSFDAFLLVRDAGGAQGPVFKGFRCILPPTTTDCRGRSYDVPDYTPDDVWRTQTDSLRHTLRSEFDHLTLLADSLEFARTPAAGFDGIGIYDNFIAPTDYAGYAAGASQAGLLFSFNVNPGYDQIEPRDVVPGPCPYEPRPFAPPTPGLDFTTSDGRALAARRSAQRVAESFQATLAVQEDASLQNARRGFLLVYINSFNEWHEGHAFEPMLDASLLSPAQRALGYHNPEHGAHRLEALSSLLRPLTKAQ